MKVYRCDFCGEHSPYAHATLKAPIEFSNHSGKKLDLCEKCYLQAIILGDLRRNSKINSQGDE